MTPDAAGLPPGAERHRAIGSGAGTRLGGILLVTGIAGAGTMIVELAAVRLLAPWFGASSAVWTNVIGVVLLALAVGYLLGARLAVGERPLARLAGVLLLAGSFTLWLPALAAPVAEFFVPRGVRLGESPELFTWGSLAAACLLFGPAAGLLGCIGPLATEVLQRRGVEHAGAAGGRVLCASTLGSLVGTFATTYLFLPRLGLSATFLGAGAMIVLPGLVLLVRARVRTAVALVLLFAAVSFSRAQLPGPQEGQRILASGESAYQFVRVVESGEGDDLVRMLQVNEGLDSFQSVWRPESGLLGPGNYYDYFVLPLWWRPSADPRVFLVGLGAGTAWRVLEGAAPKSSRLQVIGVEVDPLVVEFGQDYLELPRSDPRLTILAGWDGRAALGMLQEQCDVVLLDAYANQTEIPAHLCSLEFFREVKAHLVPGGFLAVNVGGFGLDDPVVRSIAQTMAEAFEQRVLALQIPLARNVLLYAVRDGEAPDPLDSTEMLPAEIDALLASVQLPGCSAWIEAGALVLTDNRNGIDRLQAESLALGVQGWLEQ